MGLNIARLFQLKKPDILLGGRYKIISQLGAGGFGHTFFSFYIHLPGRPQCVIKQLKPEVVDMASWMTARRLFDREASVLAQLGNHNQIPRLFAHFTENHEFYLSQELIEGVSLSQELVAGQPWPETQVIALLQDLLQVLAFVHQQSVIHRDIKPSNLIRRQRDNKIVLIDFGAVKQVSTQLANPQGQTRTISIGTQGYTPKEQLGGRPRFSSDIYAVGMVAIQALTGVHPKDLREDPQTGEVQWRNHAPKVSSELGTILECMVRYDFRTRYATGVKAWEALQILSPNLAGSGQLPNNATESTASEIKLSSTEISASVEPSQPESSSIHQSQSPQHVSIGTVPTITLSRIPRKAVKLWYIFASLLALAAIFLIAKPLLFSQNVSQTTHPPILPTGQ